MVQSLLATWRVSLHRTRADWPIVAAAALIVLLAATLLAAGPMYSSAVAEAGLRRVLRDSPAAQANVEVRGRVAPGDAEAVDGAARAALADAVGAAGVDVFAAGVSESFALPTQASTEDRDLIRLGFQEGLETNATLVAGQWPAVAEPADRSSSPCWSRSQRPSTSTSAITCCFEAAWNSTLTVDTVIAAVYRPTDRRGALLVG